MAIFTAQLEQPADKVLDFAMYLGYTAQVIVQNDDGWFDTIDNPETSDEFVAKRFKEHAESFVTTYADYRVNKATETYRANLDAQVVQPLRDAISVSIS